MSLLDELLASWATDPPQALTGMVPGNLAGLIGYQKVRADGEFWAPDDGGSWCLIIPIDDDLGIADLLALHHSGRWRLRLGHAVMLGEEALDAEIMGFGVRVFRDPLAWLQNSGDGVVVLDESAWPQLLWASNIDTDDVALGQEVRAKLQRLNRIPTVRVRMSEAVAA